MDFLIKGLILGFSIAAPVGPIGIHCIRKTLQFGRLSGLFSGLGAAVADLMYGMIAAFGVTFISNALLAGQFWLRVVGGIFLIYLGVKTFVYKTKIEAGKKVYRTSLMRDFMTTFFLTATNPMTILSFIAIFGGLGLSQDGNHSLPLVLGVFCGSALWWLILCEFVTLFRKKIEEKMMRWMNRIAGLIIFGFGIASLATALFASSPPLRAHSQNDYFSNPSLYSSEALVKELKEKTLDMCWHFGSDSHFRFVSGNSEVYFEVCLGLLPSIYDDFVAQVKDTFIELEDSKRLAFSYKMVNDGSEEINRVRSPQMKEDPDDYSYIVAERRVIKNAHPQHLSREELETIVRDKNILFYTGAGLSLASDVPAMHELNALLGVEAGERFLFSLENAWKNPREFASKIVAFHQLCLFSSPTKAHLALKELAVLKNSRVITENLDCLHEASGIYPYRIDAKQLRNEIGGESLAPFDYMICIGLSYDDHGFLGWYKQQNPQGKIIAIDLKQPSYLGDEDFLVVGDLQEVIPSIQEKMR